MPQSCHSHHTRSFQEGISEAGTQQETFGCDCGRQPCAQEAVAVSMLEVLFPYFCPFKLRSSSNVTRDTLILKAQECRQTHQVHRLIQH